MKTFSCTPLSTVSASGFLILVSLFFTACGQPSESGPPGSMPPARVSVMEVETTDFTYSHEYPGRIRGSREVEVRARVGGILQTRLYAEGEHVEQDTPLFQLDPEPYEIALQQADADYATGKAAFNQADREMRRIEALFAENAVSERERDNSLSEKERTEAQLKLLESRVRSAQLNLDYTTVKAPISGITGLETLSEGNLIDAGTLLTTLVQRDPVHVHISLPQEHALLRGQSVLKEVQLLNSTGSQADTPGKITFTDSRLNERTGTLTLRTVFDNPKGKLIPGQFVRIRVPLQVYPEAILIPTLAVGEGPEGPQVFVLTGDHTVESRPVRLGPVIKDTHLILEGLEPGEKIVVNGLVTLFDGAPVQVPADAEGQN